MAPQVKLIDDPALKAHKALVKRLANLERQVSKNTRTIDELSRRLAASNATITALGTMVRRASS